MRMTESRLRRVIRQVIRENYFPTASGIELLEKIYMRMIPVGGSYNFSFLELAERAYGKSCVSCEFVNVVPFENGDGASFGIKEAGSNDVEQFELFLNSTNRPEIIAKEAEGDYFHSDRRGQYMRDWVNNNPYMGDED
tara:strand:+ start:103 stop:516 length:414 start_codon:yes stop_codon:yes gene_type:complete